jgi:type VI protein secretion system component VasF
VVLLAGSATALRGQTPGTAKTDGQAAQNSTAPGAQPAQTNTIPADTKPADTKAAGEKAAPGQAAVPGTATPETATPGTAAAGGDAANQTTAQQAADLLKLATDLVNEINETRPATLSVAVVRKTDAIEQLAKKMKGQP